MAYFVVAFVLALVFIIRRRSSGNNAPISEDVQGPDAPVGGVGNDRGRSQRQFVFLEQHGFRGPTRRSQSGQYTFGWQDFDYRGGQIGGSRTGGDGQVILLDRGHLVYRLDLERPNDGAVADSGVAVVNDWLFDSGLCGVFYVLSPTGEILISRRLSANLFRSGIAADGSVAWSVTANAPTPDGGRLKIYSVKDRLEIADLERPDGWEVSEVSVSDTGFLVLSGTGIQYLYNSEGKLLNEDEVTEAVEARAIESGKAWQLLEVVENRLVRYADKMVEGQGRDLLDLLDRINTANESDKFVAKVSRRRGEVLNAMGDVSAAVSALEHALSLDEKVGAKRMLSQLRKMR